MKQCERALRVGDGIATMRELRAWAYPGEPRKHWNYADIYAALRALGADRVGWGIYALRLS